MSRIHVLAIISDAPTATPVAELVVESNTKRKIWQAVSLVLFLIGGFFYYVHFTGNPLQLAFVEEMKKSGLLDSMRFNSALDKYKEGRFEESLSTLAPLLRKKNAPSDHLALGAWLSYRFDRYARALELAERALEKDPERAREHALAGACYLAGGHVDRAIEHSKEAVRLNPRLTLPYLTLGEILIRQDRNEKAILVVKRGARNNPRSVKAWNLLSSTYLKMDQLDKAILTGQAALEIDPNSAEAHYNLSRAYYKQKDSGPAIRHIQLAEDLYEAQGETNWTAQARQAKEVMLKEFKMRPEDIIH
ncbi:MULTISPECIES: tetratricopeptide repeat protein [unclassified Nitrospina]|uniref:tetratricopeptide repeat protein n=1 Tax=unclassified Nitrospina TaxID=2638683 RepID=UPI003F9CCFC8